MTWKASSAFAVLCLGAQAFSYVSNRDPHIIRTLGPQGVNLWKLDHPKPSYVHHGQRAVQDSSLFVQDSQSQIRLDFEDKDKKSGNYSFRAQWFQQPLDHFDQKSQHVFHQRYWVNARHYKPRKGAPVIVLDGGETSGEDRLPFLDSGIVEILTRATGGVGVVLEHRYYGASIPVSNLSTDALRFLTNEQSMEDSANFMKNVKFDGIQENLTAPGTPWIYYGGSYAGARAAHMKVLYPDIVWGAIASSAVTHASLQNWEYMEIIREAADSKCSDHIVNSISTIDDVLSSSAPSFFKRQLKNLFGLADLEHDEDFASVLESPLGTWQAKCWDPKVGSTAFDDFCELLGKPFGGVSAANMELPFGHPERMVSLGQGFALDLAIINYGRWIKEHIVSRCPSESSIEECFGTFDDNQFRDTGIDQEWRLWLFQVCTQWGYFTTAPPDQNMPRIVSRLLTLGYQSKICKQAFPPGEYFSVPSLPNITAVNAIGDFDIAADRLAIIDGEVDPWRPNTPHSDDADDREDTILRPFKIIPDGVHHYDEYGLKNILDEPPEIRKIHGEMITFVIAWLKAWNIEHRVEE